jgi:hypothetical protein
MKAALGNRRQRWMVRSDVYSPKYERLSHAVDHVEICIPNSWLAIFDISIHILIFIFYVRDLPSLPDDWSLDLSALWQYLGISIKAWSGC